MQNEQAQALRMSAATLKKEIGKFCLNIYLCPAAIFIKNSPFTYLFLLFTEIEFDQKEEGEVEDEEGIK